MAGLVILFFSYLKKKDIASEIPVYLTTLKQLNSIKLILTYPKNGYMGCWKNILQKTKGIFGRRNNILARTPLFKLPNQNKMGRLLFGFIIVLYWGYALKYWRRFSIYLKEKTRENCFIISSNGKMTGTTSELASNAICV